MPQHHAVYEAVARDRVAELRRTAEIRAGNRLRISRPQVVLGARTRSI